MESLEQLRQRKVATMQISLKQIRQVGNISVQDFSEIVGLSRQSINNLESSKVKMSHMQYIAVCAVIDHLSEAQPELVPIIRAILNSNDTLYDSEIYGELPSGSFVKDWFNSFPADSRVTSADPDIVTDLIRNYKVFLDDTALCEMNRGQAVDLVNGFSNASKHFIVPLVAVEMLQRRLVNGNLEDDGKSSETTGKLASLALNNLSVMQIRGVVEIRGDNDDYSIASTLASVFIKFRGIHRLALITQNRRLAMQILGYNNDNSAGFPIKVLEFTEDHYLESWDKIQESNNVTQSGKMDDSTDEETNSETSQSTDISSWGIID